MVRILLFSACVIFGVAISSILAGLNKKPIKWIINMFSCALLTCGGFVCVLYTYAKLTDKELSFFSVFPDKISLLLGMYVFVVLSIVVGFFVGAVTGGGLSAYMSHLYRCRLFSLTCVFVLSLTLAVSGMCAYTLVAVRNKAQVVINEICHHNFNLICDSGENYSDYIELYNAGEVYVDLSTLYISDSPNEKNKCRLPQYFMAPGEYVLIWADGVDSEYVDGAIHVGFRLSDDETVILSDAYNKTIEAVSLPALPDNVALTRVGKSFAYAFGTPLKSNEGCVLYRMPTLDLPVFGLESGFYSEDILLEITAKKGADIYYTTDGSIPNENSKKYTGALKLTDASSQPNKVTNVKNTVYSYENVTFDETPVEKANIIRAVAINKKGEISEVATGTYFVGEAAKKYEGCSVLSVIADPDDLFGESGICVTGSEYDKWYNETDRSTDHPEANFMKHGRLWERDAVIQLWDERGELALDQNCGMRVQGNTARVYAKKRFSFYAREHYSESPCFDAPIFPGRTYVESFYTKAEDIDYIVSALLEGRELATQGGVPVVMFIDGELYSVTYLREKQNSDYFYDKYGIAEEDLVVVSENVLDEGTETGYLDYKELIKLLNEKDASDPLVYEEICKRMDVQSFIDFMTVNLYCNNIDISLGKNMRLWRSRTGGGEGYLDGRWRFALYDTDAVAWAYYVRTDTDFLETDPFRWTLDSDKYPKGDQKYIIIPFFENLLKNENFREQFVLTYLDIANETFSINGSGKRILDSIGEGDNAFVLSLLEKRAPYAIGFLKYALDITGENCSVCIKADNPKAGRIKVNTVIADTEDGEWTGEYISGYSVTLTAIPEEGYVFAGWEGDVSSTEESLTVDLTEAGLTLEAVFEKEGGN